MADDQGKSAPSLEPPRLWRKKKDVPDTAPVSPAAPAPRVEAPRVEAPRTEAPRTEAAPAARVETPWVSAGAPTKTRRRQKAAPAAATAAAAASPAAPTRAPAPAKPRAARQPRPSRPSRQPRPPRQRVQLPPVDPRLAAAVTGLLVGGWLVLSTFSTLRMCESVRGASACGGPGMLLLVVIVAGGVALGGTLLRTFKVRSAGSTSFLAVALVSVLVMIFFAGSLDQWWVIPVVAVLTIGAYSLAHWITATYIDPQD